MSPRVAVADQIFDRVGALKPLSLDSRLSAQSRSTPRRLTAFEWRMIDLSGALFAGAAMPVRDESTRGRSCGPDRDEGRYVVRVSAGSCRVTVSADGFGSYVVPARYLDVGRQRVTHFQFAAGDRTGTISVDVQTPLTDRATATVGNTVTAQTVQQNRLNGRHFTGFGPKVPGSANLNFGPPVNVVGTLTFGRVTRTHLPGEAESSGQIHHVARLTF